MRLILFLFAFGLLSCGQSTSTVVKNELVGYSIVVLPGWTHELDGENLFVERTAGSAKSVMSIHSLNSNFATLEESVRSYAGSLVSYFDNARKVSQGESEINGVKSFWYRMKANQGDVRQEVLIHMLQFDNKKFVYLICVAEEANFGDFEEEITKMVYSFERLK
jgi:hypothetical protein